MRKVEKEANQVPENGDSRNKENSLEKIETG
jgi:hypothetical protein